MRGDKEIRTLDLFCGGGGSSWGARTAGADIVCGVDAWNVAARTYAANFGDAAAVNLTLKETGRLPLLSRLGDIDLILASPECRSHTCARGSRQADDDSQRTARYVLRFARRLKPRWIVIENVVHMRNWDGFRSLIEEAELLGYHIRSQVLDASSFGVPQKRRRLFLMCDRQTMPKSVITPNREPRSARSNVIAWDGPWLSRPLYRTGRADATIARAERAISVLGTGIPFLIVYYGSDGSGGWQSIDVPLRTVTTLDRFGLVTWVGREPMLRMLQPLEIQRAMGFDAGYRMPHGSRRDRIKLLGNAVCPPVMSAVVASIVHKRAVQRGRRRLPSPRAA